MRHIVFFSSGIGSYCTAKRVIEKFGKDDVFLLFADTTIEHPDNYRFLYESSQKLGAKLVHLKDGRDIWEVFKDNKFLGNSKLAHCTFELKQKPCRRWIEDCEFSPEDSMLYIGIDWSETHRLKAIVKNHLPYQVVAPMCEYPYLDKLQMLNEISNDGLKPPLMYSLGYSHSNCGGMCVKGGQAYWKNTLNKLPANYALAEAKEKEVQPYLATPSTYLTRQVKGERVNLSLAQLREEIENAPEQLDLFDWGGCGCFSEG